MQIHYGGKVSKAEYLKAIRLHYKPTRRRFWISGFIVLFLVCSVIYLVTSDPSRYGTLPQEMFPAYPIILVVLTYPWWVPLLSLSSYNKKGSIYYNQIEGIISETEITINTADTKTSRLWAAFTDYAVGENVVLLYLGKNRINIYSKSLFSDSDDWERFTSLLKERLPKNEK